MSIITVARDRPWETVLGVFAVAGILLAIPLARTDLEAVAHVPAVLFLAFTIVGIILAVGALVALVMLLLRVALTREAVWCDFRPVSRRDAKAVCEMMRHAFGEETPTATRLLEWQRRNKTVMTAVYRKRLTGGRTSTELVGVFKIVPLRAEAIAALEQEQLSGATLSADLVATVQEVPAAYYIGDVLAVTVRAKGEVLRGLFAAIEARKGLATPIYTRPLSDHGARLVKKYNFMPVTSSSSVGALGRIHKRTEGTAR